MDFMSRIPRHHHILFYVSCHHSTCTNSGIAANMHVFDQTHVWPDVHIVTNDSSPFFIGANRKKLAYVHIIAYHGSMINDDTLRMSNEKSVTNPCG